MPNTTSTKVLLASVLVATFAGTATAQTVPDGCFVREYDSAHLAAIPTQFVARLMLNFYPSPHEDLDVTWVDITADMAPDGRAAAEGLAGRRLIEIGGNFLQPLQFGVECDGGSFDVVSYDGDTLLIETEYVRVSTSGCGGEDGVENDRHTTLAEVPGQATQYLLYRADAAVCEAN